MHRSEQTSPIFVKRHVLACLCHAKIYKSYLNIFNIFKSNAMFFTANARKINKSLYFFDKIYSIYINVRYFTFSFCLPLKICIHSFIFACCLYRSLKLPGLNAAPFQSLICSGTSISDNFSGATAFQIVNGLYSSYF